MGVCPSGDAHFTESVYDQKTAQASLRLKTKVWIPKKRQSNGDRSGLRHFGRQRYYARVINCKEGMAHPFFTIGHSTRNTGRPAREVTALSIKTRMDASSRTSNLQQPTPVSSQKAGTGPATAVDRHRQPPRRPRSSSATHPLSF